MLMEPFRYRYVVQNFNNTSRSAAREKNKMKEQFKRRSTNLFTEFTLSCVTGWGLQPKSDINPSPANHINTSEQAGEQMHLCSREWELPISASCFKTLILSEHKHSWPDLLASQETKHGDGRGRGAGGDVGEQASVWVLCQKNNAIGRGISDVPSVRVGRHSSCVPRGRWRVRRSGRRGTVTYVYSDAERIKWTLINLPFTYKPSLKAYRGDQMWLSEICLCLRKRNNQWFWFPVQVSVHILVLKMSLVDKQAV